MKATPPRWTIEELSDESAISILRFRTLRLEASDAYVQRYHDARARFELLLTKLAYLNPPPADAARLADAYSAKLGEAIRYLAGPPISEDDLRVIADVPSVASGALGKDATALRKVHEIIERVIDPFRFPWVAAGRAPTEQEREAALLASAVLLATQRVETDRRNEGKDAQEAEVKRYLHELGFEEAAPETITTLVKGPQRGQFCAECLLGERKADVVIRLHDTRLMPIECKVSNSGTNSIKRLNNDAAVKAEYWLKAFGAEQIVPAALLSGVFKLRNLEQSQRRGLALFWSHDLDKLGAFIESTAA